MSEKTAKDVLDEWISAGFKGLLVMIFSLFTFLVNQLNGTIGSLTAQLKGMEQHQVETDKRVAAIEVSRESNMESYKKLITDFQDMKSQTLQNTLRLEALAAFRRIK